MDWNEAANWAPGSGFPNAVGDGARIVPDLAADQVINLNRAITIGAMVIGDAGEAPFFSCTIAPGNGGSLTFDNGENAATLTKSASTGLDVIVADVTIGSGGLIVNTPVFFSNSVLDLSGKISGGNLTKTGEGVILLEGDNTGWSGTVTIARGGIYTQNDDAATNALTAGNALVVRRGGIFYANTTAARAGSLTVASISGRGAVSLNGSGRYLNVGGGAPAANTITVSGPAAFLAPGDPDGAGALTLAVDNVPENIEVVLAEGALILDLASASDFDSLVIRSPADASNGSALNISDGFNLVINLGYAPAEGALFKIVDLNGTAQAVGQFAQKNSVSAKFQGATYFFDVLYNASLGGGDGNDIVLRVRRGP